VIGGGLVGCAIAYGLRGRAERVAVLDEGDVAYRASRGNFGLIWVQSKGLGMPAYGQWTAASARLWLQFAQAIAEETGIDVNLEQPGGLNVLLSEQEVEARVLFMSRLLAQPGMPQFEWKLLDRKELADLVPGIGSKVLGAVWTPMDGHVNPLKLLRALHSALTSRGADYLPNRPVAKITRSNGVFELATAAGAVRAKKIVLAAGLGNAALAPQVGLRAPVRPQRGQILVLERAKPFLSVPIVTLRQTNEGTVLIGDSKEEAGFAEETGLEILATLASRAVATFPALAEVRVTRSWGALRVMSQDGFPVYDQSETHPGAFLATCHSGVTLAAAHAMRFASCVAAGELPAELGAFSSRRFDVPAAA
jgi:hydrogen cyanide synthase HcnC